VTLVTVLNKNSHTFENRKSFRGCNAQAKTIILKYYFANNVNKGLKATVRSINLLARLRLWVNRL